MAIVTANPISSHLRGNLAGLVFRHVQGRVVVSKKGDQPRKESMVQKRNRDKFREASWWAKKQLLDPQKKSFYQAKAKKLKLPNAYTAAVSDYMRKSVISYINVSRYKGKAADVISMKISKKDFDVRHAEITLYDQEGLKLNRALLREKTITVSSIALQKRFRKKFQ